LNFKLVYFIYIFNLPKLLYCNISYKFLPSDSESESSQSINTSSSWKEIQNNLLEEFSINAENEKSDYKNDEESQESIFSSSHSSYF